MISHCTVIRPWLAAAFILMPFLAQRALSALDDGRRVVARRIDPSGGITLDGRLTEAVWRLAEPATGFLQQEPAEGEPATEKTEVYVLFDENNLYIGAKLHDGDSNGILAYQMQRDANLDTDDRFRWIFDTFQDGRTAYFFEVNPAGMMGDGLLGGAIGSAPNQSWDGIWDARTRRSDAGWSVEIVIPFRTLNFDPESDSWRVNFQRTIRRKNEEVLWSGHRRNQGLYMPVHAGLLVGLEGVSQGLGLEVIPYGNATWRSNSEDALSNTLSADAGLDLQYSVTPSLRAAFTINTDFAEVEVDQRQVNLTRFPLYFPEKRDFFLEGSSVYAFSPLSGVRPYFSRRIGLEGGRPVPITYGARLGGRAGRYELGFLHVRTGRHEELPAENFTVARVKKDLLEQSSLGVIYTRRATSALEGGTSPPDRHTIGFDLDMKTSHFLGNKNLQFEAFAVLNTDPAVGGVTSWGDLTARGIRVNYPNDTLRIHTSYREFGDRYDPALGFIPRNGFRRVNPGAFYLPRPHGIPFIRQFEFGFNHLALADLSNRIETQWTDFTVLGINFESRDRLQINVRKSFERLKEPFDIHDEITLPVGEYRFLRWTVMGSTASHRILSGSVELSRGGFWSGNRSQYGFDFTIKPRPGIRLTTEIERNDISLAEGDFSTNLLRTIGEWHMNPWVSVVGSLQYDDVSRVLGLFSRLRWILKPGSNLYFVYTHNWLNEGERLAIRDLTTFSRSATLKLDYTHRF